MRISIIFTLLFQLLFWGTAIYLIVHGIRRSKKVVEQIRRQQQWNAGVGQDREQNAANHPEAEQSGIGNVPEKQPEDMGTMEYLQIKADRDAREHEREDYEFRQQIMRETGGAAVGERYIEGMSISPDKICVHCRYCGADNLLQRGAAGKCTCYFCREFL